MNLDRHAFVAAGILCWQAQCAQGHKRAIQPVSYIELTTLLN